MRLTIHRGAHQIGGSCVELESSSGERLILDIGRPLDAPKDVQGLVATSLDLTRPATVLISHPHMDHWGLVNELSSTWPVWTGSKSAKLIELTANLFNQPIRRELRTWDSRSGTFEVGAFKITPFLTDHSAFDAYMLLIEADGRRLFYTGDFRTHGRKSNLVEQTIRDAGHIDVLLMEGTNLRSDKPVVTESGLELEFFRLAEATPRHVFVDWSAQNIDRTVTLFRAARRAGRDLVVDLYSADVLDTIASGTAVPHPSSDDFPELKVVITRRLAALYRRQGRDDFVSHHAEGSRGRSAVSLIKGRPAIIMSRRSLVDDYAAKGLSFSPSDAFVHSNWSGYLNAPGGSEAWDNASAAGANTCLIHTSGHASATELARFANALAPRALVPIHGVAWDEHGLSLPPLVRLDDGQSWVVT